MLDEHYDVDITRCINESFFFFFNDTATTEIYTLSLHDALPISRGRSSQELLLPRCPAPHAGCGARGARRRVPTRLTASTRPRARPPLRGRFPPKPAAQQALTRPDGPGPEGNDPE